MVVMEVVVDIKDFGLCFILNLLDISKREAVVMEGTEVQGW
jgi:hypothetical protein